MRNRILLAAMMPVTLIVLLLVAVFLQTRLGDNAQSHGQRSRSLARQLAAACEYGVFSANESNLRSIAVAALREPDLRSVVILSADGAVLVRAGVPGYAMPARVGTRERLDQDAGKDSDLYLQPIMAGQLHVDDLFAPAVAEAARPAQYLGHVLLEVSKSRLLERERELIALGVALGLAGLLIGGMLALRLGQRVIDPMARVASMIRRIRGGDFSTRTEVLPDDPLRELQRGLNQMAESLESSREELEQRVARATLALREKKEEAETATLAKSRFLAAASHDLRQPTHALGMFVARLRQLKHDAETRQLIDNLELALQAMRDLLDGLLDISRLDAGSVLVQLQVFPLEDILEKLRLELGMTASGKGLRLRIRPSAAWVLSDPTLIHRILLNLIGNALRYCENGGVVVGCRSFGAGELVRIEVWDSGIGIAPEHQQAIFREFFQVGNLERDRGQGLGLGLNIVQRTANLLGHRLQLCSLPGVGSRFSIEVPAAAAGAASERRGPSRAESFDADLSGVTVQVIEDDALARLGVVSLLSSWGARVVEADRLSTALRSVQLGLVPDVVVSDCRLPDGENGIEVVRQLRLAAGREIPACLISGDTDADLLLAAKQAGLTLLHKPVRPAKLRNLIRRLATQAQAVREDLT